MKPSIRFECQEVIRTKVPTMQEIKVTNKILFNKMKEIKKKKKRERERDKLALAILVCSKDSIENLWST